MTTDLNHVVLIGRLTRDAELRYLESGMAVCKFSIAVNHKKKDGDQWIGEAHFFDIVLWGKSGEAISQYLTKGKQVAVDGELRQNTWEKDGQKHSKVEVNANSVQLLSGGQEKSNQNSSNPAPANNSQANDYSDQIPF